MDEKKLVYFFDVISSKRRFGVYQALQKSTLPLSVKKIAKQFKIHPNIARTHLEKLKEIGLVETHYELSHQRGRPERKYRACQKLLEISFPSRNYALLSKILAAAFAKNITPQEAAFNYGKKIKGLKEVKGLSACASIVKNVLSGIGSETKFEIIDNKMLLTKKSCWFNEVARENPELVCLVDFAIIKGLFNTLNPSFKVKGLSTIAEGNQNCLISVSL